MFVAVFPEAIVSKVFTDDEVVYRLRHVPPVWHIASTCSGTGNFELASKAIAQAINDEFRLKDSNHEPIKAGLHGVRMCLKTQLSDVE